MSAAKFPVCRDLDGFEFHESPVNEQQIRDLYAGQFLEDKRNIVLIGGTGTGKSHLAIAIATHAVRAGPSFLDRAISDEAALNLQS